MNKYMHYLQFLENEIQREYYFYKYDYNFLINRAKEIKSL